MLYKCYIKCCIKCCMLFSFSSLPPFWLSFQRLNRFNRVRSNPLRGSPITSPTALNHYAQQRSQMPGKGKKKGGKQKALKQHLKSLGIVELLALPCRGSPFLLPFAPKTLADLYASHAQ